MGRLTADPVPTRGEDDDLDLVPAATPTTPDALCWIWAAIPPKDGRIHVARVAQAVDRSPRTIRRWIAAAPDRDLDARATAILRNRAFLRGHGDLLWPALNDHRERSAQLLQEQAEHNLQLLADHPDQIPAGWRRGPTLQAYQVYAYYHHDARVFGVATGSTRATANNLRRMKAQIIQIVTVPSKWHAQVLKYDALDQVAASRCIPPRSLIPAGRTETWWRRADAADLAATARRRGLTTSSVITTPAAILESARAEAE